MGKSELLKNKKELIMKILPWVWLGLVFVICFGFFAARIDNLLDSDMAGEMVLAKHLNGVHGFISKEWSYSTEIFVLNNQMMFQFFMLFIGSWRAVRIVSAFAMFCLLLWSYYFMCSSLGLKKYFPYTAAFLLMPFSMDYAEIVLLGLYYMPYIIISFFSIGFVFKAEKTSGKKRTGYYIGGAVLALIASLAGLRQIVVCYLPLILTVFIYHYRTKRFAYLGAYIELAAAGVGYLINSKVLQKFYDFNDWSGLGFKKFSFDDLGRVFNGVLSSLGFCEGEIAIDTILRNLSFFAIIIGLVLYYRYTSKKNDSLTGEEWFTSVLLLMMLVVYLLIYSFTDMYYVDRYALPFIVFAIPLLAFTLDRHGWTKKGIVIFEVAFGIIVMLGSNAVYKYEKSIDKTAELKVIVKELVDQDYSAGYATYWNSSVVEELSDGKLEMRAWADSDNAVNVNDVYDWLIDKNRIVDRPEGKVFIILHAEEQSISPVVRYVEDGDILYNSDEYMVLGYDSYEDMLYKTSDFTYNLDDPAWMTDGTSEAGRWYMNPGCVSTGPTITFYAGSYLLTVNGENLDGLIASATANFDEEYLYSEVIEQSDSTFKVLVTTEEDKLFGNVNISNISENVAILEYVRVERVVE